MTEQGDQFHIQGGVIRGISYNLEPGVLTSWEVDANSQSYRKTEETVLGNIRRITTETKLPWISLADKTTIVEERQAEYSRRIKLEEHGDQKSLSASFTVLSGPSYFIQETFSHLGNLSTLNLFFLDQQKAIRGVKFGISKEEISVELLAKHKELVSAGTIQRQPHMESIIGDSLIIIEDSPDIISFFVPSNSDNLLIKSSNGFDYQALLGSVTSPNTTTWQSIFDNFTLYATDAKKN